MPEYNEFLFKVYINSADTGALIERVDILYIDDADMFQTPKDVQKYINKHFSELCRKADKERETKCADGDVYRIHFVYLENEVDEDDGDDEEDDENTDQPTPPSDGATIPEWLDRVLGVKA